MPPKVLSAQSLAEKAGVERSVVGPGAIVPTSSPHPAARAPEKETWTEAGGEGIVWPGGICVGPAQCAEDEQVAAPKAIAKNKAKAKAKAKTKGKKPSSSGARKTDVKTYSTSYTTIAAFPACHIFSWLKGLGEDNFHAILENLINKAVMMAYLFLMTGVCPGERPPAYNYDEIVAELTKEYNRFNKPLVGDAFLEPEVAVEVAKKWMVTHASKSSTGEVTMPARVAHPGVEWIARNALPYMKKHSKEAPLEPPQTKQLTQGSQQALTTEKDDEFKVIFRDGGFRLLKINWLGKRVADVPLPAGSNLTLVRHEGQPYLSSKGGTELYSCEEYVSHVMQAGPQVPGAGSSGSTKDTPAKIEEKDEKTLQSCTYKIRFEKGAFKLYKFDGAGGDCGDVMLPVPVNMYEVVACDGIAAIKDGELSFKCSDVFHVLSATTEGREEQSLETIMKSTETKFTLRFEKGGFILSKLDSHDKVLASEMLPMPSSMYSIFKDEDGAYYIKDGEDDDGVLCTAILDDLEVDRQKKTSGAAASQPNTTKEIKDNEIKPEPESTEGEMRAKEEDDDILLAETQELPGFDEEEIEPPVTPVASEKSGLEDQTQTAETPPAAGKSGPESVEVVAEESLENPGTGLKRKFSKISIETISDDNK